MKNLDWATLIPIIFAGLVLLSSSIFSSLLIYKNGRKQDEYHSLTNSNMPKRLADLAAAREEIRLLNEQVGSLNVRLDEINKLYQEELSKHGLQTTNIPNSAN